MVARRAKALQRELERHETIFSGLCAQLQVINTVAPISLKPLYQSH
jgi:hypothetical protein